VSFNLSSFIKVPQVLQVVGVAVFAITVWKGVHGFFPFLRADCRRCISVRGETFCGSLPLILEQYPRTIAVRDGWAIS